MDHILQIKNVSKHYGKKTAVNNVSLEVPEGSVFGLLGPNGAGKTSLIRMITTITRPDSGEIWLNGERLHANHPKQIGYLPEERGLYKKMKVGEHLLYLGRLKGLSKTDAQTAAEFWLNRLALTDRWDQSVEALSKGLQQQVQFIATVMHRPRLLILDEPFSGLDPVNTNRLKAVIDELHQEGISIIFSTHRMEQVEEICRDIALINNGQKVLEGNVAAIRDRYKQHHYQLDYRGVLPPNFTEQFNCLAPGEQSITIATSPEEPTNTLLHRLMASGVDIRSFTELLPSLNEIFIRTVRESLPVVTPSHS